ncbi:tyrosine-type recombinase/integrase [Rhodopila sp.]|uniref:tyrosine-type recombinase/integrase n=1 Tax=Rhodopila sp. TaxID=2480087 RepID=UPI003D10EA0A
MPRIATGLTVAKVRSAKPGRYADGNGLYLFVRSTEARFWVLRYRVKGQRSREMGLGPAASLSFAEARAKAAASMALVKSGVDPLARKEAVAVAAKAEKRSAAAKAITFRTAADQYIAAHESGWRNQKHREQWANTLRDYVHPAIGSLPVGDVATDHVTSILRPLWNEKTETASRVRGRIEVVLDYAKTHGWRDGENPARWRGHLENVLPKRSKVARVEHHAALPWHEMVGFMAALAKQDGLAARALELTILTAARTSEALNARWSEIDLDRKVWIVPADRMKANREHRVPLASAALGVFSNLLPLRHAERGDWIFPGARSSRPLSNMAMLMLLRRMDREDLTAHGFRSTFRDWAAETGQASDIAEMALAHTLGNKVQAAYQRGDLLERRRGLMEAWASFCYRAA